MDEEKQEQDKYHFLRPYMYKKGQSGNPTGRPKGSISLKEYLRLQFLKMSPEEREDFLEGIDKKTLWEMAEGKPDTKNTVEATVEVKPITGMKILKDE